MIIECHWIILDHHISETAAGEMPPFSRNHQESSRHPIIRREGEDSIEDFMDHVEGYEKGARNARATTDGERMGGSLQNT